MRNNNYDLIRFLLASLVLFSHSALLLGRPEPLSLLTRGQVEGGEFAVNFFFVLSGALITRSWAASSSLLDFTKKRVFRIYPGYLAAVAVCVLIVGPLAAPDRLSYLSQVRPLGAALTALLLSGVIAPPVFADQPSRYMNASLWTIPYEFSCYALVALAGLVGVLKRPGLMFCVFLGLYLTYLGQGCQSGPPAWSFTNKLAWTRLLMYFSAGSLFSTLPDHFFTKRSAIVISCLLLGLASQSGGLRVLLPILGSYVLFAFGMWRPTQFFIPKPKIDISYGIYLYAYPIQQLLIHFGVNSVSNLNLLSFLGSILAGAASWFWVELPAIRRIRQRARPVSAALSSSPT